MIYFSLQFASVTGSLAQWAQDWVTSLGVGGVFVLMLLDCACIPIPSEVTMLFAGFGVSSGKYSLIAIIVAGVLGNVVGSLIAYGVGYAGVERFKGSRFLIHGGPADRAHAWFERYGAISVLVSRCLPIVRTFISLPAGIARMPLGRFTLFTLIGCIPWVAALGAIGDSVGNDWTKWRDNFHYLDDLVIVGIVALAAYVIYRRYQQRSQRLA